MGTETGFDVSACINIKYQDGPIKENGINGCQIDDVLASCSETLTKLNTREFGKYQCQENEDAIHHIEAALTKLKQRTAKREERGVEGTSAV